MDLNIIIAVVNQLIGGGGVEGMIVVLAGLVISATELILMVCDIDQLLFACVCVCDMPKQ